MRIYFIGICGTAMGNAALMMRALGHDVSGSDTNIYPPMSLLLAEQGVRVHSGYTAGNLEAARPELVVIGNAMSRGNEEVEATLERKLPFTSLPELLKRFVIQGRDSIVVAGTHGKTSTSSLLAWTLEVAGKSPCFLIGGVPENFGQGYRVDSESSIVVLEGDEYDTAFFDKRSKFLHYLPTTFVINNLEFDHADIFASLDEIKLAFRRAMLLVPRNGLVLANGDDPNVMELVQGCVAPVMTFGIDAHCNWMADDVIYAKDHTEFTIRAVGMTEGHFTIPLFGKFNVRNALAVAAAAHHHGATFDQIREAFRTFKSVKRRLELKGVYNGITIYDDFAHHPTAIGETLKAVRQRHPELDDTKESSDQRSPSEGRLIAIFEPRSNTTRRNIFQDELAECFELADVVFLSQIARLELLKEEERLNPKQVILDIELTGAEAYYLPDAQAIAKKVGEIARPGDVIVVMSNGGFGGIHDMLREQFTVASSQ